MKQKLQRWSLEWNSKNNLDGTTRHLIFDNYRPVMFFTRKEARQFALNNYGYIKDRKELRMEPHGWRLPRPVKIKEIVYEVVK